MDVSSLVAGPHCLTSMPCLASIDDIDEPFVGPPLLISAGYDQSIKFWDVARGEAQENFTHKESQINAMRISPDGTFLAIAGWQHFRVYNLAASPPTLATSCDGITRNVTAIDFLDRTRWFYSGGEDCTVKLWDFNNGLQCRRIFQVKAPVNCVAVHSSNATLIASDLSGALYFWDLRSDVSDTFPDLNLDVFEHITCVDINRAADTLIGVTNKGKLIVWEVSSSPEHAIMSTSGLTLQQKLKVTAHAKHALKCYYSPDYKHFVTTGADGFVHLWDGKNPTEPVKSLYVASDISKIFYPDKVESKWVWDCAFTSDSKYLFTASGCQLRLWNLETGELARQYQGHSKTISCFAFREGRHIF